MTGRGLAHLGRAMLGAAFESWAQATGFAVEIEAVDALVTAEPSLLAASLEQGGVVVSLRVQGRNPGTLAIHFPRSIVARSIASLQSVPEPNPPPVRRSLTQKDMAVFRELSSLLCGAWNDLFVSLELEVHVSQSVDDLRLFQVRGNGARLAAELAKVRVAGVRLQIAAQRCVEEVLMILPASLAKSLVDAYSRRRPAA